MENAELLLKTATEVRDSIICPLELNWVRQTSSWVDEKLSVIPGYGERVFRFPLDGGNKAKAYWTLPLADIHAFIAWDWIDNKEYIAHRFNCENYAFTFMVHANLQGWNSVAIVIDWSGGHGYNILEDCLGNVYVFEPQNDSLWGIVEHKYEGMYKMESAAILE